jgi:hypothetical protein
MKTWDVPFVSGVSFVLLNLPPQKSTRLDLKSVLAQVMLYVVQLNDIHIAEESLFSVYC